MMGASQQHTFQVLTKRSTRLRDLADQLPWPPNVWMGVSIKEDGVLSRVAGRKAVVICRMVKLGIHEDGRDEGGTSVDVVKCEEILR